MNRLWRLLPLGMGLLSLAVFLLSVGCSGSNKTQLRLMNAMPDESILTFLLNGNSIAANVAYQTATSYQSVNSGSPQLQVEPSGTSTPIPGLTQTLNLSGGNNYTFVAVNFSASAQPLLLMDQNTAPASGDVSIRVVNASPSLGAADVYIVAAGTSIDSVTPTISNLAFGSASTYQSLNAATNYEVIFAPANTKFTEIDSGPLGLTSGQVRTVVGLNSQGGGFTDAVLSDLN